jgi:RHS repeat-associated protein
MFVRVLFCLPNRHLKPIRERVAKCSELRLCVAWTYNGMGDRLSQTVGITTTRYVLDPSTGSGQAPAAGLTQVLADGTNTYLYGNDRLAQYQGSMQYFGADGLGSVRQIYDASAQVVGSTRYDPYGNVMNQSGTATSVFAFAGEQYDAGTGLEYLRARYYSSAQGRFTTRDVWEGDASLPMSYNEWNYVNGNPTGRTDPSGMMPRAAGVCLEPPDVHSGNMAEYFTEIFGTVTFVYCGQFELTSYQFISQEDLYDEIPVAVSKPVFQAR